MTNPATATNAWIFLNEDEPGGTNYTSGQSCYQSLIDYAVYNAVDMLGICFFKTSGPGNDLTLEIGPHAHHGGFTNGQYLQWITRDSRAINPNIKLLATLDYGTNWFDPLFSGPQSGWQANVNKFAANLTAFLQANSLDGFDIDWESPICFAITQAQFAMLFQAIRSAFNASGGNYLYLTMAPAQVGNLDPATVNTCFDCVTLQLYSGFTRARDFLAAGVSQSLLAYGAKFEATSASGPPFQTAQQAYADCQAGTYGVAMQWRLNSTNYQFEQAEQVLLAQLMRQLAGNSFDDSQIVGAAGNPPITQLIVRHGNVVDALQATNTGAFASNPLTYNMLQHGGNGGKAATLTIAATDPITQVSGYTGTWFGWNVVVQIAFKTRSGQTYGPFGSMFGVTSKTPFSITAPSGQSIVAFKGTTQVVPEANAPPSAVIASLACTFG